jgi:hypothetical protein
MVRRGLEKPWKMKEKSSRRMISEVITVIPVPVAGRTEGRPAGKITVSSSIMVKISKLPAARSVTSHKYQLLSIINI